MQSGVQTPLDNKLEHPAQRLTACVSLMLFTEIEKNGALYTTSPLQNKLLYQIFGI
jgi:hypothetical protein